MAKTRKCYYVVSGNSGSRFKGFEAMSEAESWMEGEEPVRGAAHRSFETSDAEPSHFAQFDGLESDGQAGFEDELARSQN
ncbi:hypothetical protein JX265_002173 [Neoarthrinium moseri]|uniref:Uncharacterized protein n=1 Tax=Neoarthrinium moseri TaxID=1658444 RepID=A0A9Q0AQ67_9PEZI|nr:hypothetical protein JX265_002173 [Neoarthrinium moseri]